MRFREKSILWMVVPVFLCAFAAPPAAGAGQRINAVSLRSFAEDYSTHRGQWGGIISASDGNIYFFLSTHERDRSALMFRHDPASGYTELVSDLDDIIETPPGLTAHGKVHSEVIEDDGTLFFTTHFGPVGGAEYEGGRFLSYDIETGEFTDYGVGLAGHGLITMTYCPEYRRAYALTAQQSRLEPPIYLIILDVESGTIENKGVVQTNQHTCRSMFVDSEGMVYWSQPPGNTGIYNPETDEIKFTSHRLTSRESAVRRLPVRLETFQEGYGGDINHAYRVASNRDMWYWIIWDARDGVAYGINFYNHRLFSFNPRNGRFTDIGLFSAVQEPPQRWQWPEFNYALAPGQTLYYISRPCRIPTWRGPLVQSSHLMSYDIPSGAITNHGPIYLDEENIVGSCNALTVCPEGNLYFVARIDVPGQSGPRHLEFLTINAAELQDRPAAE